MDYSKYSLGNGTEIYVVTAPIFTHTRLSMHFYSESDKGNAARSICTSMIQNGSKGFPSSPAVESEAERLFGSRIWGGTANNNGLNVSYTGIESITKEGIANCDALGGMLSLMAELLYRPLITAGKFNEQYFDVQKQQSIIGAKRRNMDKESRAGRRFIETALGQCPHSNPASGSIEDIANVENMDAVWAWQRLYEQRPRKIFAATNLSPDYIAQLCSLHFNNFPFTESKVVLLPSPEKNKAVKVEEDSQFDQAIAYVGFPVEQPKNRKEAVALRLLNFYLGGHAGSRLFSEIRMKRDLAYYARSSYNESMGLIYGSTGVSTENKDKATEIMLEEMKKAAGGKITKKGFNKTKQIAISRHLMGIHSKSEMVSVLEEAVLRGLSVEDYENPFSAIAYEDVIKAASMIKQEPIIYCQLGGKK